MCPKKNSEGCEYKACEELTADTCDLLRFIDFSEYLEIIENMAFGCIISKKCKTLSYDTNHDYDPVCTKNIDSNPKTDCITRKCSEFNK